MANTFADRHLFLHDAVVWLETPERRLQVSRVVDFTSEPWPIVTYEVGGLRLAREVVSHHGAPLTLIRWRLERAAPGVTLCVRPLLSVRGVRARHEENPDFAFAAKSSTDGAGERVRFATYPTLPKIISLANADYRSEQDWPRNILYQEQQRGSLDAHENLASPGVLRFDLTDPIADWIVALDTPRVAALIGHKPARVLASELRESAFWRRKSRHCG
jgi:glycogen debranching enzyme-like protein